MNNRTINNSSPSGEIEGDLGRIISLIIIHCSAVRPSQTSSASQIDKWHKAKGWKGIGYHYVVRRDGTIELGRSESEVGAHCKNHNKHSIGICYEGGLSSDGYACDTRTTAQKQSLTKLLTELHERYPRAIILGHRDLSPDRDGNGLITPNEYLKQCPCFDAMLDYADLQPDGFFQ